MRVPEGLSSFPDLDDDDEEEEGVGVGVDETDFYGRSIQPGSIQPAALMSLAPIPVSPETLTGGVYRGSHSAAAHFLCV